MNEADANSGVSLQAALPLAWADSVQVSNTQAELRMQTNIAMLRALAAIDVVAAEHESHGEPTQKGLERIEAKIDVVMLVLAQISGKSMALPAEKQVTMFNNSITWLESSAHPAVGANIVVDLYLNPRLPQALHLPVTVKELQPQQNGVNVFAEFLDSSEEFDEWLTRTLFRYHRRALQASKQA